MRLITTFAKYLPRVGLRQSPVHDGQILSVCLFCRYIPQKIAVVNQPNAFSPPPTRPFSTASIHRVQESLAPQTHYDLFPQSLPSGPPPKGAFNIDVSALKREFLQLQSRAHPDRHPQSDKLKAEALSARINEAYRTLLNPLLRAQYLLTLRGIDLAADEEAKVEDPELLMSVLDARERIEDAEDEGELAQLKAENEERLSESVDTLEEAFKVGDVEGAKREAVKLRYWVNIKESIDAWEKGKPVVLQH